VTRAAAHRRRRPVHAIPAAISTCRIPDRQRAALAWRLRDMLARADRRAADYAGWPTRREMVRVDAIRGDLLGLIAELETGSERG
jgi:hypothetical protein